MVKKILCLTLAVAMMATLLAGCGDKDKNTLLIGGIGALTGDYANYGTSVRNGAQIAVDEINEAGGINGFKVELNFQDSAGDQDSAVQAYGKLMDSQMDVSLGAVFSGECKNVVSAAANDDILLLTPSASADNVLEGNDKAFRICFNDSAQGKASAQYIADRKLATKIAVFYASDVDYCVGLYKTFEQEAKAKGLNIVEVQTFTDSTKTDFSTQINAIKASGADLLFMPIYAQEAATFLTQAYGKLNNIKYFGCDGLDGILTKVSDAKYAEGVMMLTPFSADDPDENVKSFVAKYKEKHNADPDQFAADGYDAVYTIKAAIEKAGVKPENKGDDFTSLLVKAMTEIEVKGLTGTMTWSKDGETTKEAKAMIIKDGKAALYQ